MLALSFDDLVALRAEEADARISERDNLSAIGWTR